MKSLILVCVAVALAGCLTTDPVYLRNMTGAVVQCGPYDNRPVQSLSSAQHETQCIQDYQRQGFERVPKPG